MTPNSSHPPIAFKLASPFSIFYGYNDLFQQHLFSLCCTSPTFANNLDQIFTDQIDAFTNDMSDSASAIFVPSHSSSPTNNRAGSTPYVVASPPPDSPTDSEAAWPHQMMLEHIATILGTDVEEVCRHFPTPRSLLPINIPPPCLLTPNVAIPSSPTLQYPGTELENYVDPSYPNSPPSVSPSSPVDPLTLVIIAEGEQYENEEEWENSIAQDPQLCQASP